MLTGPFTIIVHISSIAAEGASCSSHVLEFATLALAETAANRAEQAGRLDQRHRVLVIRLFGDQQ